MFLAVFFFASGRILASDYTEKNRTEQSSKETNTAKEDTKPSGKHAPLTEDGHHKAPHGHGKAHAPHSEELPHIHKFHKERLKKNQKHHGKFWFLSQLLLFICHAAILYISYLHAAH